MLVKKAQYRSMIWTRVLRQHLPLDQISWSRKATIPSQAVATGEFWVPTSIQQLVQIQLAASSDCATSFALPRPAMKQLWQMALLQIRQPVQ